jgi:hypothetical protein
MSRNRHITKPSLTAIPAATKKKPARDDEWFRRKVAELGKALERLPEDRRRQANREVLEPDV